MRGVPDISASGPQTKRNRIDFISRATGALPVGRSAGFEEARQRSTPSSSRNILESEPSIFRSHSNGESSVDEAAAPLSVSREGYAGGFLGRASLSAGPSVFNNAPPHLRSSGISLTPESDRPGETQLQARDVSVGVEATKTINALKVDLASEIQNNKRLQTSLDLVHDTLKELRQKITEQDSKILELEYRNQTRNAPSRGQTGM